MLCKCISLPVLLALKMNNFTETISRSPSYLSEVRKDPSKRVVCKIVFIRSLSGWKGYIIRLSQLPPQLCLTSTSYSELFMHKILFSTSITWWLTNLSQIQLYYIIKIFWIGILGDLNSKLTTYSSSAAFSVRYVLSSATSSTWAYSRCFPDRSQTQIAAESSSDFFFLLFPVKNLVLLSNETVSRE